jgi:integrase
LLQSARCSKRPSRSKATFAPCFQPAELPSQVSERADRAFHYRRQIAEAADRVERGGGIRDLIQPWPRLGDEPLDESQRRNDLRHAFGTAAITRLDAYAVQSYMGHAHYSTTQRYLHHKPRREDAAKLAEAFGATADPAAEPSPATAN